MTRLSKRSAIVTAVLAAAVVFGGSSTCQAFPASLEVHSGYDLFQSEVGTSFQGLPYMGVPIGNYDFGVPIGVKDVGMADTIIQRTQDVTVANPGDTGTTNLVMRDLQLESVVPVSGHHLFITLQSMRSASEGGPGPASTGSMNITFASANGGTFTSMFDVFFDVRVDGLQGPIIQSGDLTLDNSGASWSRTAPPGAELINGVNNMLDGTDTSQDFWPGTIQEVHPGQGQHIVDPASAVPEPATLAPASFAALLGTLMAWRSRRKAG
jgi:hypothetical protein